MKKIFTYLLAVAAIAACTKSEVQFDEPEAIGFQVVSGKMTKAAVNDSNYPTGLDMFVFAQTNEANVSTANYLKNARFGYNKAATENTDNQETGSTKNLWAGDPDPYYWPNEKSLYFAGVSESGNVNAATNGVAPTYSNGVITIDGYVSAPGTAALGDNDLMWFPKTPQAYGKGTKYVPVEMKHACSWITIKLVGDGHTADNYTVTDIHIEGLTTKGKVTLGETATWDLTVATDDDKNKRFDVFTPAEGSGTALPQTTATETGFENITNNTIVLPGQVPGTLSISYKFKTQANIELTETVTGSLKFDGDAVWAPGTHYTYTVTIGASQILIAPEVQTWVEDNDNTVTVQ